MYDDSSELSRYAYRLHNCATTYARRVASGECFLYVAIEAGTPKTMLELKRDDEHTEIFQLQGPCNQVVPEELTTAVHAWFDAA